MKEHKCDDNLSPRGALGLSKGRISRRDFLATMIGAAGLLAGCRPAEPAIVTATPSSTPPDTPTPASTPTSAPTPTSAAPTPGTSSKVVHTHHTGVWDGEELAPAAIRQMLDASITKLTGLDAAAAAWASLFDPGERIAIKVNAFRNSIIWTKVPLVMAVTECLQEVGVPAEQIVIFDFHTSELETAGFSVNKDGSGVRCYGSDGEYAEEWEVAGRTTRMSNVLLDCDALINIPVLKSHMLAGISFAMKNHYGTIPHPAEFHRGPSLRRGMAELNALPPIKDRTRLIIGDVLTACLRYNSRFPYWEADYTGDSILMSFDPVAHDTVGLQLYSDLLVADGGDPGLATSQATPWLESGAELGLGINHPDGIDQVEVNLG